MRRPRTYNPDSLVLIALPLVPIFYFTLFTEIFFDFLVIFKSLDFTFSSKRLSYVNTSHPFFLDIFIYIRAKDYGNLLFTVSFQFHGKFYDNFLITIQSCFMGTGV